MELCTEHLWQNERPSSYLSRLKSSHVLLTQLFRFQSSSVPRGQGAWQSRPLALWRNFSVFFRGQGALQSTPVPSGTASPSCSASAFLGSDCPASCRNGGFASTPSAVDSPCGRWLTTPFPVALRRQFPRRRAPHGGWHSLR